MILARLTATIGLTSRLVNLDPRALLLVPLIMLLTASFLPNVALHPKSVEAQEVTPNEVLSAPQPIHTTSRFETKLVSQVDPIAYQTITQDDPNKELDDDTVVTSGKNGQKTTVIKISYYEGKEYSQEILSEDIVLPQNEVIDHGTKIVWRNLDTPGGTVSYWRKIHVWATQYDSHCPGCDNTTATGLPQGKGVIAVDPSVIKLGSKVYVPGYGAAIAGDTGGSIKGDIIDLGFPDAHTSGWYSHFVDIYLLGS